jgi:hypothetical protein
MRWAGHVARVRERKSAQSSLMGESSKERSYLGKQDIEGRIILKWIIKK